METPIDFSDMDLSDDLTDFIFEYVPRSQAPAASPSAILSELAPAASASATLSELTPAASPSSDFEGVAPAASPSASLLDAVLEDATPVASPSSYFEGVAPAASPAGIVPVQAPYQIVFLEVAAVPEQQLLAAAPAASVPIKQEPQQEPQQKQKRGAESGRRRPRERKRKLHEVDEPFQDEEQERKRLNAINAKRHRVLKQQQMEALASEVEALRQDVQQKKALEDEVVVLRRVNQQLRAQLEAFQTKAVEAQPTAFGGQESWAFLDDFTV